MDFSFQRRLYLASPICGCRWLGLYSVLFWLKAFDVIKKAASRRKLCRHPFLRQKSCVFFSSFQHYFLTQNFCFFYVDVLSSAELHSSSAKLVRKKFQGLLVLTPLSKVWFKFACNFQKFAYNFSILYGSNYKSIAVIQIFDRSLCKFANQV